MNERLELKGRLSETKRKARDNQAEIEGLIILLRNIISPYESDPSKLNVEAATANMARLHELVLETRELKVQIAKFEKDLE
jgi:hypothetical protein